MCPQTQLAESDLPSLQHLKRLRVMNAEIVKDEKGKMSHPIIAVKSADGASLRHKSWMCNSARTFTRRPSNMAPGNEAVHPEI